MNIFDEIFRKFGKRRGWLLIGFLAVFFIFIFYFAATGLFQTVSDLKTSYDIQKLEKQAEEARKQRDEAKTEAAKIQEQLKVYEQQKTEIETERNELLLRYRDLREKSEAARLAYDNARRAGLRLDGLTDERFKRLSAELDKLDEPNE